VTLISLGFWIDIRPFQDQVSPGAEIAEGDFLLLPSGDDDWSRNFVPSGSRSILFDRCGTYHEPCSKKTETFLFGGISPPNKITLSPRPPRLCGEIVILDRYNIKCK